MTTHCHYCGVSTDRIEKLEAEVASARAIYDQSQAGEIQAIQIAAELREQLASARAALEDQMNENQIVQGVLRAAATLDRLEHPSAGEQATACRLAADTIKQLWSALQQCRAMLRDNETAFEKLEAQLERAMDMLADVGGETLDDRLTKYIGCYMGLQAQLATAEKLIK